MPGGAVAPSSQGAGRPAATQNLFRCDRQCAKPMPFLVALPILPQGRSPVFCSVRSMIACIAFSLGVR